jgi:phosphoribosylamine--glycine ligase
MKVLVIGKGAREHALCWRLSQSPSVWGIYCAGGNPGINRLAQPVPVPATDFSALASFVASEKIDLTVVGPEDPLALGIVDEFRTRGLAIFGPTSAAAQLESSKAFAKSVMSAAGVATARGESFDAVAPALDYIRQHPEGLVVKADGLALGKGVVVCADREEACEAVLGALERRRFGEAGAKIVIEERLAGEELSFFALCDGANAVPFGIAQDHKAIFDEDRGPNTGGMGAYSPAPRFDAAFENKVMLQVIKPVLDEMARRGTPFTGVLFAGLMVDGDAVRVLEFNVRFGDPECEVLMMRFEGDLGPILMAAATGGLREASVKLSPRSAVSVVLASGGYPGEYRKGIPIEGLGKIEGGEPSPYKTRWAMNRTRVKIFQAGTTSDDAGRLITDGGRVLAVTASAGTLEGAVAAAYQAADLIEFDGKHLRRDIARRALGGQDASRA